MKNVSPQQPPAKQPLSVLPVVPLFSGRRMFMRYAGVATATGLVLNACTSNIIPEPLAGPGGGSTANARAGDVIDLGSGDVGVLNYAYALEQAELRFLELVCDNFYDNATDIDKQVFIELRNQEITHREFFKKVLGSMAIPTLTLDYSSVNFRNRDSVLDTAIAFADLATAAYNGAGQLLTNATNLAIGGIIVSVEARHAAVVRELRYPNTAQFAGDDVVDPATGLDPAKLPNEVVPIASKFIKEILSTANLPTPMA
ncbi:ferritin-like domain-containing protein [Spirosoma rhododendri]|uniref:Ferritin-like domain-containing protein n=1 Tax=Spirosoma rhododendri TaxID=2728024 RepID=A0A7L5DPR3_9BACT|nr:ferritin-like domain-containing protein [Spirosoma rhododendri]QJD80396.1 ferritin-like domain-containing protein [Spirosoma rhododendri]